MIGESRHRPYNRAVLALTHVASGKVREIYEIDERRLLFVATDRISAYDVILPDTIPEKARRRLAASSCRGWSSSISSARIDSCVATKGRWN